MFASTAIENKFIYVYGGISKGTSRFPCSNSLPKNIVEKYDTNADSWSEIHIQNAPNLSSFGWCKGTNPNVIFILGGSDGQCLSSSLWRIDFVKKEAEDQGIDFDTPVCLSKMAAKVNNMK